MRRRLALFLLGLAIGACGCTQGARPQETPSWQLALRLRPGERLVERSYEIDRIGWKLPKRKLERFRAEGVIINEERHVTTTINAVVVSVIGGTALLRGTADTTSLDVPRAQMLHTLDPFTAAVTRQNKAMTLQSPYVEDAAMEGFPHRPVSLGTRWQTKLSVTTNLGSGMARFDHRVVGFENGRLQIAVSGSGAITGAQYHLPKLLPGTISITGMAWYDPSAGLVVQESYAIRNRIIKPMEGEESGFDEQLSVDTSTRSVSKTTASRIKRRTLVACNR
jgi:hypothetical protein